MISRLDTIPLQEKSPWLEFNSSLSAWAENCPNLDAPPMSSPGGGACLFHPFEFQLHGMFDLNTAAMPGALFTLSKQQKWFPPYTLFSFDT